MRFYTVPDGRAARRSVVWAIWLIGGFFLAAIVIGYGAAALVGPEAITAAAGESNAAAPLLAYELGGEILLGVVAAIAFATILAVVAGLTITASASFAHDVYAGVLRRGRAEPHGGAEPAHQPGDEADQRQDEDQGADQPGDIHHVFDLGAPAAAR